MNLKLLLSLTFCCFISFTLSAQSVKKVSEVLELQEGCPLPNRSELIAKQQQLEEVLEFEDTEIDELYAPPSRPAPPLPDATAMRESIKTFFEKNKPTEFELPFGKDAFVQNTKGLWGVRAADGTMLIDYIFEVVRAGANIEYFSAKKVNEAGFNLYHKTGKAVLKQNYRHVSPMYMEDFVHFESDEGIGIANLKGKVVVPPKYDWVQDFNGMWLLRKGGLYGLANKNGKLVIPIKYTHLKQAESNDEDTYGLAKDEYGLLTIFKNGKKTYELGIVYSDFGSGRIIDGRYLHYNKQLIDLEKNQYLICGERLEIEKNNQVHDFFAIKEGRYSWVFNAKGELILDRRINSRYHHAFFYRGYATVSFVSDEKDEKGRSITKYGLLSEDLNWQLPPDYTALQTLKDTNLFIVKNKTNKYGLIDLNGKTIIPFKYVVIKETGRHLLGYKHKDTYEVDVMDSSGKVLFEKTLEYSSIRPTTVGYEARPPADNKRIMLNEQFEEFYSEKYNNFGKFGSEAVWIERFGETRIYEVFDYKGEVYPITIDGESRSDYKVVRSISRSPYFLVRLSDDSNYIFNTDTKKSYPIDPSIAYINGDTYQSHGLLITGQSNRNNMGVIDTLGNEILAPRYKFVNCKFSLLLVMTKDRTHIFSVEGEELFGDYDDVQYLYDNYFAVKSKGKWGVMNSRGEAILPIKYKSITNSGNHILYARVTDRKSIPFDLNGKEIEWRKGE